MSNEFIEKYRILEIKRLMKMKTFINCWNTWKPIIDSKTENLTNSQNIFDLGSSLSEIFTSTGGMGRNQSTQSGGGAAWEALVCWYLNLILSGTNAIAFKQTKGMVPPCIFDAATVKYGNYKTNTESDISLLCLPADCEFSGKGKAQMQLDDLVRSRFSECHLRIVQCKTNWNDNAQIPMLWDMVYQGNFPENSTVRIGNNGFTIKKLKSFKYAFVTVPTGSFTYRDSSVCVQRLRGTTGGNYWGRPSKNGIASALSEIFGDTLDFAFAGSVQSTIDRAILDKVGVHSL